MGVVMLKAPSIFIPQRKINEIKVSGRNGVLHEDEKTYQNYTKDAECHVMDRSQIDEVCGWLTGFGEVIFSSEPDKVYRAYIKNQIEFGSILKNINDFLVQFDVEPFKYSVAEFPRFEVGKNEISWTGNVSKIKIQPRWRWL